jgi:hypothetical protein
MTSATLSKDQACLEPALLRTVEAKSHLVTAENLLENACWISLLLGKHWATDKQDHIC